MKPTLLAAAIVTVLVVAAFTVTHHRNAATGHPSVVAVVEAARTVPDPPARTVLVARRHGHRPRPSCTTANWRHRLRPIERWIDRHESGVNPTSREPSTGAYGLGQLLPSTYANLGLPMSAAPCAQIGAQRAYLDRRYGGSWLAAKAHWRAVGWW